MCCKKDDVLTKEYQARTEPIIAWKIMYPSCSEDKLKSKSHWESKGGTIRSPVKIEEGEFEPLMI